MSNFYYNKLNIKPIKRTHSILNNICNECGRNNRQLAVKIEDRFIDYCTDCWKEMNRVINKNN